MAPASGTAHSASRFAETLAGSCATALGEAVAGVILHGSLTLDDYVPGRSDVDLLVVTRQVAASPTPAPPMELSIEITPGSGLAVERRHPGERDLAVELSMCRAHGRSLLGAAPAELIGEVPDRSVLTTCRVWRLAEEGRHCSKTAAGEWALGRDPTLQVVRDALRQRHRDPAHRIDAAQVAQLLALVRARLTERRERAWRRTARSPAALILSLHPPW